jgi:hypothetical protein
MPRDLARQDHLGPGSLAGVDTSGGRKTKAGTASSDRAWWRQAPEGDGRSSAVIVGYA